MNESALIPAELEAIQAAIREVTAPSRTAGRPRPPMPPDHAVATAILLELARRWAAAAPRALRCHLPGPSQVAVEGVELVEGRVARAEVQGAWLAAARTDEEPVMLVAIHGAVIETIAARRCGDAHVNQPRAPGAAPSAPALPSAAALRLFEPAGWAVLQSWAALWRTVGRGELVPSREAADIADLLDGDAMLRVSLAWSGSWRGRCVVYVVPAALVPLTRTSSDDDALEIVERLAEVPVDVRVELGSLRVTLEQLRNLQPGTTLALPSFVDSRVPIYVGGVIKAWGTPVVHRGVLAVTVEQVVGTRGSQS